ncbi:hypothetical protein D3C78_1068980 [compost metagenome]
MRITTPGLAAILTARALASSMSCSGATTRDTRPQSRAWAALMASPVKAISAARARPTARGSSQAPPSPGTMPTRTKLSAKVAVSEAMRMSHMQVRSRPAPIAGPLMAQITGTSNW